MLLNNLNGQTNQYITSASSFLVYFFCPGFVKNAHWSEEDQCCYQPIRCAVCEMKPDVKASVIGYKLVAVGPNLDSALSDQVGNLSFHSIVFFPKELNLSYFRRKA